MKTPGNTHNTIVLNVCDLYEHPLNHEIYGSVTVDGPFLDSIRTAGILQPPIVTPIDIVMNPIRSQDETTVVFGYRIVAGHRRVAALKELNVSYVECIVKDYDHDDQELYDFVSSNQTRAKDTRILILEVLELLKSYQSICQRSGDAGSSEKNDDWRIRAFEGIDEFEGLTLQDVALKIGASKKFVNAVRGIFMDDFRDQYITDIKATGHAFTKSGLKQFVGQWDRIRDGVLAGEVGIWQAYDAITSEKRSVVSKAEKKAGKVKPPKVTKPKVLTIDEEAALSIDDVLERDNITQWMFDTDAFDGDPMKLQAVMDDDAVLDLLVRFGRHCYNLAKGD